jgi:hypothetical protein
MPIAGMKVPFIFLGFRGLDMTFDGTNLMGNMEQHNT